MMVIIIIGDKYDLAKATTRPTLSRLSLPCLAASLWSRQFARHRRIVRLRALATVCSVALEAGACSTIATQVPAPRESTLLVFQVPPSAVG